jgi:hypothetical protein
VTVVWAERRPPTHNRTAMTNTVVIRLMLMKTSHSKEFAPHTRNVLIHKNPRFTPSGAQE